MSITALDLNTALVVIDLQKGIVGLPTVHPIIDVLASAAALVSAFRRHGLPVVLVNVTGTAPGRSEQRRSLEGMPSDWAELAPELNVQPSDLLITKRTWGAFTNTGLDARLKALGITQLVLAGVSTSIGVESTARHGHELGFNIALAVDAMTDLSLDAHNNSVERIFPRLGETGLTRQIVDLLDHR